LQDEATELQYCITELTQTASQKQGFDGPSARDQVLGVFSACLPVMRARISNLTMAQELLDSALENISLSLRMESLGFDLNN